MMYTFAFENDKLPYRCFKKKVSTCVHPQMVSGRHSWDSMKHFSPLQHFPRRCDTTNKILSWFSQQRAVYHDHGQWQYVNQQSEYNRPRSIPLTSKKVKTLTIERREGGFGRHGSVATLPNGRAVGSSSSFAGSGLGCGARRTGTNTLFEILGIPRHTYTSMRCPDRSTPPPSPLE